MSTNAKALTRTMAIRTIVAPYDFSPRCRAAARHAVRLARHYSADLVLVHVIPFSSFEYAAFEGGGYVGAAWPTEQEVLERLEKEITELEATPAERKSWTLRVLKGDPPEKIEQVIAEQDHPFIVMPTHGYGAFRRFVLGSVTTKVLHDLDCPVMTGAHLDDEDVFPGGEYRRIACAIDLGEHSSDTLHWANQFARSWDAELLVLHSVDWLEHSPAEADFFTPELQQRLIDAARDKAADLLADEGFPDARLRVGLGPATKLASDAVRKDGVDVLVIGRSLEQGLLGRMRSRAHDLIRSATCPVVSV